MAVKGHWVIIPHHTMSKDQATHELEYSMLPMYSVSQQGLTAHVRQPLGALTNELVDMRYIYFCQPLFILIRIVHILIAKMCNVLEVQR